MQAGCDDAIAEVGTGTTQLTPSLACYIFSVEVVAPKEIIQN